MVASSGEPSVGFDRVENLLMISSLPIAPVNPDYPFTKQHPRTVWRISALGLLAKRAVSRSWASGINFDQGSIFALGARHLVESRQQGSRSRQRAAIITKQRPPDCVWRISASDAGHLSKECGAWQGGRSRQRAAYSRSSVHPSGVAHLSFGRRPPL